jgi:transcription elongation factor Elf1
MKKTQKEDSLQRALVIYKCPECNAEQLISKPDPKHVPGGGVAVYSSVITCLHCKAERNVKRYPSGTYKVSLVSNKNSHTTSN